MSTNSWNLMGRNRTSRASQWMSNNLPDRLESAWSSRSRQLDDRLLTGLGFLTVGALVGVGLGLLMAPKSGSELRSDLSSRLGRGRMPRLPGSNREPDINMSPEYGTQTSPHTQR